MAKKAASLSLQFIQVQSGALIGLDYDGRVWSFDPHRDGWEPMPMVKLEVVADA